MEEVIGSFQMTRHEMETQFAVLIQCELTGDYGENKGFRDHI